MRIKTAVAEKTLSKVGMISGVTIVNNVDQSRIDDMDPNLLSLLNTKSNPDDPNSNRYLLDDLLELGNDPEAPVDFLDQVTGTAEISGLSQWNSNAGIEVEDVDTLGLMFTYNINENIALQLVGGVPPKVDLKGKGQVYAPFSA